MKEKLFLFIRDSLGDKDRLKQQEEELREFANAKFKEPDVIVYEDINKMLQDIENNSVNWVLVTHINRLFRIYPEKGEEGLKKLNEIVDRIVNNDTGIISVREEKRILPCK